MRLPAEVDVVCHEFCSLMDTALPGRLVGLYLHGSIGWGEWYAGTSDVDFVAVLDDRLHGADLVTLSEVHAELGSTYPSPRFDGLHVVADDLARPPGAVPDVPSILAGLWEDEGRVDLNPVTWHELAAHGVTVRGPAAKDLDVHLDQRALRRHTHESLAGYWAETAASLADFPAEAGRLDMVAWTVLGTSRLHHLLEEDDLTSKTGAGMYAWWRFGERWKPLASQAMTWRKDREIIDAYLDRPEQLAADNIEFTAMVVESGLAIPV